MAHGQVGRWRTTAKHCGRWVRRKKHSNLSVGPWSFAPTTGGRLDRLVPLSGSHLLRSALASLNKSVELSQATAGPWHLKLVHASAGQYDFTALHGSFDSRGYGLTTGGQAGSWSRRQLRSSTCAPISIKRFALFKQALAQNPKYERALAIPGRWHLLLDQFEECVDTIDQALALSPESVLVECDQEPGAIEAREEAESEAASEQALGGDATLQLEQPYLNRGRRYSVFWAPINGDYGLLEAHELQSDSAAVSIAMPGCTSNAFTEKLDRGIELAQTAVRNLRPDTPAELWLGAGYARLGLLPQRCLSRALDLLHAGPREMARRAGDRRPLRRVGASRGTATPG